MVLPQSEPDLERRARRVVIWEDLINPVRAIQGYQELVIDQARRLGLATLMPDLDRVLTAADTLSRLVDTLRNPSSVAPTEGLSLVAEQSRLRHDLRTPLNAIIGYSEMVIEDLDEHPDGIELKADVISMLREARQLLERIDAIVNLTHDETAAEAESTADAAHSAHVVVADLLRTLNPTTPQRRQEIGRILIIDDNESNRELLSRRLAVDGHDVLHLESGAEALAILERDQSFDLVLLDVLMPGMNGLEVLARLKADRRWHAIPVIMISGLTETDAVLKCIELGAEDYLPKPCDVVLLRARINACLERSRWREREREYLAQLEEEKEKSDRLIRNILPEHTVLRLNDGETIIADRFESASILFADIVGFTLAATAMPPRELVDRLDRVFSEFDVLALKLGVEKIKTIGDAYMAAAGLPERRHDHAEAIIEFAIGMLDTLQRINQSEAMPMQVRIGVHMGPVVAGVIGRHKFIYDVWGDTVNIASRLESEGAPNRITVSSTVKEALNQRFAFEHRGMLTLKGKGRMRAFFLVPPSG